MVALNYVYSSQQAHHTHVVYVHTVHPFKKKEKCTYEYSILYVTVYPFISDVVRVNVGDLLYFCSAPDLWTILIWAILILVDWWITINVYGLNTVLLLYLLILWISAPVGGCCCTLNAVRVRVGVRGAVENYQKFQRSPALPVPHVCGGRTPFLQSLPSRSPEAQNKDGSPSWRSCLRDMFRRTPKKADAKKKVKLRARSNVYGVITGTGACMAMPSMKRFWSVCPKVPVDRFTVHSAHLSCDLSCAFCFVFPSVA